MSALLYLVQVCGISLLLWGIFRLVWYGRAAFRAARIFLLLSLLLAPLLPLISTFFSHGQLIAYRIILPEIHVGLNGSGTTKDYVPAAIFLWLYYSISVLVLLLFLWKSFRLHLLLRHGIAEHHKGYTILRNTGIGPGTLWRTIFFPKDIQDERIFLHELAHIRSGHRYDLLLTQIMNILFWISPAHWLIQKELKMLHEFEADAQAIGTGGLQAYARLLLAQSFGITDSYILAHSFFHHPLKQRIIMLQKSQQKAGLGRLLMRTGVLCTTLFFLCLLIRFEPEAKAKSFPDHKIHSLQFNDQIADGDDGVEDTAVRYVENMPEFNGDLNQYLAAHIKYPASAQKEHKQGRVGIEFIVRKDGKIGHVKIVRSSGEAALDAEAVRVIKGMPDWKPGTQGGKPVDVYYTIPISFQLEGK
ncbi:MAG: TonB family protein [Bacteroidetes bacterium]|nr:TonB family protein [Bacteroidota bacterium]MBS1628896.1 TonB family protein [Bacteroidota bacterium]